MEGRLMAWLSRTDFVLLLIAAYVAVITLVRLMKRRHDEVVADVQRQVEAHRRDKKTPTQENPRSRLSCRSTHRFRLSSMKLYIETVGCQMNMLDSELVVASLRKDGLRADRRARTTPTRSCSTRAASASMPKTRSTAPWAGSRTPRREHPDKVIGVLGCMAQKDQRLIFKRAPYVDLVVGPGQLHQIPDLHRRDRAPAAASRWKSASTARTAPANEIERSLESFDPLRDPAMRPTPYQAYVRIMIGCDKFCTYCIVPSVRGPEQSRPPAADPGRSPPAGRRRLPRNHAAGPNRQQLPATREGDRTWRLSRSARPRCTRSTASSGSSSSRTIPKDMTDDLLAAVRDLPKCRQYLHVPAQSGSNDVLEADEARLHGRRLSRDARPHRASGFPSVAVTSDFIVGFCGETDDEFQQTMRPGPRVPLQEQLHLQVQRAARHQGRRAVSRRRARRSQTPPQQRTAGGAERDQRRRQPAVHRPQVEVLVEGPSKAAEKQAPRRARAPDPEPHCNSPAAPTATGSSSSTATAARSARSCRSSIYDANAHTLFGEVVTSTVGPGAVHALGSTANGLNNFAYET